MPAIGIGAVLYALTQAALAGFVYREADAAASRSPAIAAVGAFACGIVAALLLESVVPVLALELVAVLLYLAGKRARKRQSSTVA